METTKKELKSDIEKAAQKVFLKIKRDLDQIIQDEELGQKEDTETESWDWVIRRIPTKTKPGVRCSPSLQRFIAA
ncbi:MAG TPA: hypothetical protein PK004_10620 [Smithella sp.]|nr:hypothetical protein [Smithella sp.]